MRKFFKFVLIAGGAFVGLLVIALAAAAIIIPRKFPPEKLKAMAVEKLSQTLNRKASVGDVKFDIWNGFAIHDLKIGNRPGWTAGNFVSAENIAISYHLFPLLWGQISLGEIVLDGPQILVERKGLSDFNFSDMAGSQGTSQASPAAKGQESTESSKPSKSVMLLTVGGIHISHGKITYLDERYTPARKADFPDLNLKVKNISLTGQKTHFSLNTPFNYQKTPYQLALEGSYRYFLSGQSLKDVALKGKVNDAEFELEGDFKDMAGNFAPAVKGSASLEMIKVAGLVPPSIYALPQGLSMSGPARISFQLGGDLKKGFEFSGVADGKDLAIRYKDLFLKAARTPLKLEFKSVIADAHYDLPSFHAVFQDWEAEGSFRYQTQGPYAFTLKTKTLPLKGLSSAVPRWKDTAFAGTVAVDLSCSQKAGDLKSLHLNGRFDWNGINVSQPKEPGFLGDFSGSLLLSDSAIRIPQTSFKLMNSSASADFSMSHFQLAELSDPSKFSPWITFHLKTDEIDLGRLQAAMGSGSGSGGSTPGPKGKKSAGLPITAGTKVDGTMNFKGFTYRKMKFKDVACAIAVEKRVLKSTATLSGFGGSAAGVLNANFGVNPSAYAYGLNLKGVRAEQAIDDTLDSVLPEYAEYKGRFFGALDLSYKGTGKGTSGAEMAASALGSGTYTAADAKLKGYAFIKMLNSVFKDSSDAITFEKIEGTLGFKNKIFSYTANSTGKVGTVKAVGAVDMDNNYAPDMKVQCDIKQEFLNSDTLKANLPAEVKDKWDVNLVSDEKGNVPVDFRFTGPVKRIPGPEALDLTRLKNLLTGKLKKEVEKAVQNAAQGAVTNLLKDAGDKLKDLFGK